MSGTTTVSSGSTLPFTNLQRSLAITQVMVTNGIFPSNGGGSPSGDMLGFIYDFAGTFAPGASLLVQGQLLSIADNVALFNLLGTTYGGNGQTNFALPNLQGDLLIGTGQGPGRSNQVLGAQVGTATVTLTVSQMPAHIHAVTGIGVTTSAGGSQPFNNMEPSLPVTRLIATTGLFPSQSGGGGSTFLGEIASFAGNFVPGGWAQANGQLLSIAQNTALFSILGTTYGGDGKTTFALPDLRGRVTVGADGTHPLGSVFGEEQTTITTAEMPAHDHTLTGGGTTQQTGGGQPVPDTQPSIAINYLIATQGMFPSRDGGSDFDTDVPTLGQIVEFAGNFAPGGWALANGQLLSISTNTALFSLLGTTYGGDGKTTFALPDLRGRTIIGVGTGAAGTFAAGQQSGADTVTLSIADVPAHTHDVLCFQEGTRIATPNGAVLVEDLAVGDLVRTAANGDRPVRWIGYRGIDCARHPDPGRVWPVRIEAGAFGLGRPSADLFLSPDHAVYVNDVLVPVRLLIDDRTIRQVPVNLVRYYHVELDEHDLLLAEGLEVESYLDTGNRSQFANGGVAVTLHADFATRIWDAHGCAPLVLTGPLLEDARRIVDTFTIARQDHGLGQAMNA